VRISGLDLSLTSTGAARVRPGHDTVTVRLRPRQLEGHARLDWLLRRIWATVEDSDWVIMEGPSFGSPLAQHKMGGLWWCVAHMLWLRNVPYEVVQPSSLKIYATGRGNADKDEVLAQVIRRYPAADIHGNDEADALVLAAMGSDYLLDAPLAQLPADHRRALDKVGWSTRAQEQREQWATR
jgi:Holliday junction resolvasome RuvABC endonuclease subunit